MKLRHALPLVAAAAFAACGGGEPADSGSGTSGAGGAPAQRAAAARTPPSGPMTVPDWYVMDNDARTVRLDIVAGEVPGNNYWNFNGAIKGALAISVPEGYTVTIELVNRDPNMAHSLGIQADYTNPMLPPPPTPVFEGAITPNPQSMIDGTMPGQSATIEFVASTAGSYTMLCYVPGHTALGMWLYFDVSSEGDAGVRGL